MSWENYIPVLYNPKVRHRGEDFGIIIVFDWDITGCEFRIFIKNKQTKEIVQEYNLTYDLTVPNACKIYGYIPDSVTRDFEPGNYIWEVWMKDTTGFDVCLYEGIQAVKS